MGGCCGCCSADEGKPQTKMTEKRGCTDIVVLLLFIIAWAGCWVIFGIAYPNAEPLKLIQGIDYNGCICGNDNEGNSDCIGTKDRTDLPFTAWPYPPEVEFKLCVQDCSDSYTSSKFVFNYDSVRFINYCLPNPLNSTLSTLFDSSAFQSGSQLAARAFGDLATVWPAILLSAVFAVIFSFVYTFVLRKIAKCLVWSSLLLIAICGFLISYALFSYAITVENEGTSEERALAMKVMGYIFVFATFLFLCLMFFMRERINIAIEVVKETCSAMTTMPSMIVFPFFPVLLIFLYFLFWIYIALYIFSVTKPIDLEWPTELTLPPYWSGVALAQYRSLRWDESMQNAIAYHFFHLLWNVNFIVYFGYMVIAGCVAEWYWTPYDEKKEKPRGDGDNLLSNSPVLNAMKRTALYHLGSIALGSLFIAIIQFVRAVVLYFEKQAKKSGVNATVQKIIFCLINCCLYCMECCMDKINKNSYIWMAIYGDNFCKSCCSSFAIVWRNLARVAAMDMVTSFLVILGKILIAMAPTGVSLFVLTQTNVYKDELNSIIMPLVVIFIISYVIGSVFMTVFDTAADTVFLCFMIDAETNADSNQMFASEGLQELVTKYKKESEAEADLQKNHGPAETVVSSEASYEQDPIAP